MSTSIPYDQTTPPSTPHANSRSSNPRSDRNDGKQRYFFNPLFYGRAAASTCPANPAHRDGRTMARDDIRFVYRRQPKHLGSEIAASDLQSQAVPAKELRFLEELSRQQRKKQSQGNSPKPKPSLIGDLQDIVPQNLAAPKTPKTGALAALRVSTMVVPKVNTMPNSKSNAIATPKSETTAASKGKVTPTSKGNTNATSKGKTIAISKGNTTATPEASPKPTVQAKLKDTWTSFVGWQPRSSEVFRKDFSFSTSSRRRCDQTPPISPRTSISSSSGSPTPTPKEPFKLRRVDSSGANVNQTAPRNCSPTHNALGYNLSPTPTSPASIWGAEDISSPRPVATRTEAHPGFLVDFTRSSSQRRKQDDDDDDDYHEYLDESKRNNSSPDGLPTLFTIDLDDHKPSIQAEPLNKESRILGLSSNPSFRKRSKRKPHTPSGSSTSSSSAKTRTSSVVSDPSMDRFLEHIKVSQEKRAAKARDEDVKRWLGEGPL